MAEKIKITASTLKALSAFPEGSNERERFFWDIEMGGFGIRQTRNNAISFVVQFRLGGRKGRFIRKSLGKYPAITPVIAREMAKQIRAEGALGNDLIAEVKAQLEAPTAMTFSEVVEEYRKLHIARKRPGSAAEDERKLKGRLLPEWGKKKIGEITHSDVLKLHSEMQKKPVEANRTLALLSSLFNFAVKIGARADNPAKDVKKYDENPRERYLSKDERKAFAEALASSEEKPETIAAIHFLAETGARRNEMLTATWDQFDMDTGVWAKPASNTKQKKIHKIPLTDEAFGILKDQQKAAVKPRPTDYVFSPELSRDGLKTSLKRVFQRVCKAAKIEGFRVHDLRHTFASTLVMSGSNLPLVGKLLGHNNTATTARYAHLADDALREALKRREEAK